LHFNKLSTKGYFKGNAEQNIITNSGFQIVLEAISICGFPNNVNKFTVKTNSKGLFAHLRQVSYVECVVRLCRSWKHVTTHTVIQGDGHIDKGTERFNDLRREVSIL